MQRSIRPVSGFRAVLFRMVSKQADNGFKTLGGFRAVLFRMVSKRANNCLNKASCFRAVLFRMVSKPTLQLCSEHAVLELCCFEWFQNSCNGQLGL